MRAEWYEQAPAWRMIERAATASDTLSFTGPLEGGNTHRLRRRGRQMLNFAANDYLALGEAPEVRQAAAMAALEYGVSTGASRLVAGELELHLDLERALARFLRVESTLTFVNGHATNVTVLGMLFGPDDVVIHDQFAHNSMLEGIRLSGARRIAFRHNDMASLERRLRRLPTARRVGVCVDGVYSMEGDVAPLRELIELKRRYGFVLYVDDAHALGTIGERGAGSADAAGVDISSIDVVMGTLGKALGSCGGFIAGPADLIRLLRWTAPGFVFSAGLTAPQAAAARAAISLLETNPIWVRDLRRRSAVFRQELAGILDESRLADVTPIVPVSVDVDRVFAVAERLNDAGLRVFPITAPAVPREGTRLRFCVNRLHGLAELRSAAAIVNETVSQGDAPPQRNVDRRLLPA